VAAHHYRRHCQARAYKTLQPILYAASRQNAQVEEDLAAFLKASPTLAYHLARWQAETTRSNQPCHVPTHPGQKPGFFFAWMQVRCYRR
jgi:hypothetical protein